MTFKWFKKAHGPTLIAALILSSVNHRLRRGCRDSDFGTRRGVSSGHYRRFRRRNRAYRRPSRLRRRNRAYRRP